MIRLPTNLRSLVHARCLIQRAYSTAVHYEEYNKRFDAPPPISSYATSKKQKLSSSGAVLLEPNQASPSTSKQQNSKGQQKKLKLQKQQGKQSQQKQSQQKQSQQKQSTPIENLFEPVKIKSSVQQREKDALVQIYNYAAAAGLVPEFHVQSVQRLARKGRGVGQKYFVEVVIKLPEQGIEASAIARDYDEAVIAAAILFKRDAERYTSQQADDGNKPLGLEALTFDTAPEFFRYYKYFVKTKARIDIANTPRKYTQFSGKQKEINVACVTIDGEPVTKEVSLPTKAMAEKLAYLVAAVHITKNDPKILDGFHQALKEGKGKILQPVYVDLPVDPPTLRAMRDALYETERIGLPIKATEALSSTEDREQTLRQARRTLTPSQLEHISKNLAIDLENFLQDPALETLRAKRQALPMSQYREPVLNMINGNIYSIVVGATGSGKTTQVPQILLDEAIQNGKGATCNIICTQPRRIAATSVAQRVAEERNEKLCRTVGYHVRFDKKTAEPIGSINYCTTGILLEQLKHNPDEVLNAVSHLVIDEVHERDMNIDFLMIILKKAIKARMADGKSVPRVVLMSATLDTELFTKYFSQSTKPGVITPCPSISVPGRTFPVREMFLDDLMKTMQSTYGNQLDTILARDRKCLEYLDSEKIFSKSNSSSSFDRVGEETVIDWKRRQPTFEDTSMPGAQSSANEQIEALVPVPLVAATLAHICNTSSEGAILAFLPGLDEIQKTHEILRRQKVFGVDFMDTKRFKICTLHSTVSKEDQADVFKPVPEGCRKVILSTNIAETSVTIPDVQYVVDTGKLREKRYDQSRRITKLQCTWVSKSNSKQRAGRAGRVQNGNYYALFSRERYEMLRAIGLPELLRSDLQETCLSIKAQSFGDTVAGFLSQSIEPPAPQAIESAVQHLKAMEAFTHNEELTALGRLLAKLPVHPTLGKMIVLGVVFRCLDPLLILGAAAEERSLFATPPGRRFEARRAHHIYTAGQQSDQIAMLNAFKELRRINDLQGIDRTFRLAEERFLHMGAFRNISNTAKQLHDILTEVGLIPYVSERERRDGQYGHPSLNTNSENHPLVKALLMAGLNSSLAVKKNSGSISLRTATESFVMLHQSSVNKAFEREKFDYFMPPLYIYGTLAKSDDDSFFLRETTRIDPLTCVLFGGKLKRSSSSTLEVDGWLPFMVKGFSRGAPNIIEDFRKTMDLILRSSFQSLSNLGARNGSFFADDRLRDVFARHLVNVLNQNALASSQGSLDAGNSRNLQMNSRRGSLDMPGSSQTKQMFKYTNNQTGNPAAKLMDFARKSPLSADRDADTPTNNLGANTKPPAPNPGVLWWRDSNARKTPPGAPEKVANRWVVKQLAGGGSSVNGEASVISASGRFRPFRK